MKRWLLVAGVLAAAAAVAVVVVLATRSGIEGELRERIVHELQQRLGGEAELDAVHIAGARTVELRGLRWRPADDAPGPLASASVERVELTVDPSALLDGSPRIEAARVEGPRVVLAGPPAPGAADGEGVASRAPDDEAAGGAGEAPLGRALQRAVRWTAEPLPDEVADAVEQLRGVLAPGASIQWSDGALQGLPGERALAGLEGSAWATDDGVQLELRGDADGAGTLTASAQLVPGAPARGSVSLQRVPLDRWTDRLPALPEAASWEGGELDLELSAARDADSGLPRWDVEFAVARLGMTLPEFGELPMEVETRQVLELQPDAAAGRIDLRDWRWSLNGVAGAGSGTVMSLDEAPEFRVALSLTEVPYARIVEALPEGVLPQAWGIELGGTLDLTVRIGGPLHDRSLWDLGWKGDWSRLTLRSSEVGDAITALAESFPFDVPLGDDRYGHRVMGLEDPHFLPLGMVHPDLVSAVVVCEDASFFAHRGFDEWELRAALLENLREDGEGRGGSTITQQVAKNLFLSGERTWTRKVQEALLAWRMETSLDKRRILEIYLNRAEWGPGIFGVRDAAHHYFRTSTSQLNTLECAFLASLLPSPVRYHNYYHPRGGVTDRWHEHLMDVLQRMHSQGHIDADELARAREQRLRFAACGGAG